MSPTRWVLPRALSLSLLSLSFGAATASAQYYEPAMRSLDLSTGPLARSPRLLGMGGLRLVIPDRDAGINLWDFARLPVGLSEDDTASTLDVRPGTDALSSVRRLPAGRERQNLAARTTSTQVEGVYRSRESGSVFGVVGDLSGLRSDRPYSTLVELRQGVSHPEVMSILGGKLSRPFGGHLHWATHLRFRSETVQDRYRSIVSNSAGEYVDQSGAQQPPPGEFTITDINVNTMAFGLSTAYAIGQRTRFALGIERENNPIKSTNDQLRSSSEVREDRPFWVGHAALVGRLGTTFEYGVDGIGRLSNSEADWRFSTSAGVGADPLSGRGNLYTREEQASELHARARWSPGRATFAGSIETAASKVLIDPPNANDHTSLNRFINLAFNRTGSDTLAFPDSIVHSESRRNAWGWGGGASYRFGRTTIGSEFHWSRDVRSTTVLSSGPRRVAWDVRTGLEHPLGKLMSGRLGYAYRSVDEDEYTAGNEFIGNAVSIGFGYRPAGASWSLESGYVIEFRNQDFTNSADERQSRQNLAMQLHWAF